jgi:hypothetical protein
MLIIIGFLFSVFISVLVSIMSGMYGFLLFDVPSMLLTLVLLLFFLFATKSGSIIGTYIKSSFKKNYAYTRAELVSLSVAIKNTIKFALGTGGFGFLMGVVGMLKNLEDKNMLGPLFALSLLTVLYSIIVSFFIFFPVQAWAENKLNAMGE